MEYAAIVIVISLKMTRAVPCIGPEMSSCDCSGILANCEYRGLTEIPGNIPAGISRFIEAGAFNDLLSLELIDLRFNIISSLPAGLFLRNVNLKSVYLNQNQLRTVSANIFNARTSISFLVISENPLRCCTMLDFLEWTTLQTELKTPDATFIGFCLDFNTYTAIDKFNSSNCPIQVDGQWGSWSNTSCSVTCGDGIGYRNRSCDSPSPSNNGQQCVGSGMETSTCMLENCSVDGQWGSWSNMSCSVTCGDGIGYRIRICDNPRPSQTGQACVGSGMESAGCSLGECQEPCKESENKTGKHI
ncbi:unnamed protein product [Mytilus coruscus]|uniref:LRRNT domain-containing protein n=1 Tax=Mytilus coruscus TaxID=42192 RepID=A0A6J8ETH7_MYTCO|nr:unnamed protein product [Mytilus coruscus]